MNRRTATHVPEGSTPLQEKFVNYIMQQGKKSIARRIFKDTMMEIQKKGHANPELLFEKAIENVQPTMEVRPKRIGGAVYQIPMEVKTNRRIMLSFRWILGMAESNKAFAHYARY
ncbi:MAG: 30S ribosomal protein S7 [Candidatus Peregrinibacteria bacterium GW2011_GWA2_44_7]|nr:MAG: 30S ribosomal protein S7 [Candidatus Peregrinibacteria bacterium GW2011_GWA2_44_7]